MSNKLTITLLIIGLCIGYSLTSYAQPKDNSPFSRFGIGDFIDSSMPSSQAMGGLGAVYHDFFEANLENPASLGFLQYTCLQTGLYFRKSGIERIGQKQTIWSGNLDHLSLNIPIINPLNEALERRESAFSWGTSVSLRPYSQVGYHVQLTDGVDSIGNVQRDFKGSGGLYKFSWAHGLKYKNLAAGIDLGYLYGRQLFSEEIAFLDLENSYRDIFTSSHSYRGFQYRVGMQYEHPLDLKQAREKDDNPSKLLSIGAFISNSATMNITSTISKLAYNPTINDLDTALLITDRKSEGILPQTFGIGMMYRHAGKFRVGVDYQSSTWSEYVNEARPEVLKDSKRFAAGVAWIPDGSAVASYFRRVEYRAGFYTLTDPRVIENAQVKESAVTFGATLPLILQRNIAWLQLGFDVGRRTGGDRLSDNFVRGKVGLILNDNSWFIRRKYN